MSTKKSKFTPPSGRSNALDSVQTSYADPKEVDYKALKVGEAIVVRILSLGDEHIANVPHVYAATASAKHQDKAPINRLVPLPEDMEDAENIFDDTGVPLSDGDVKSVWYIPVVSLYKLDGDGFVDSEIGEVQYLKAGPGMVKSIKELSENVKDDFEFDSIPPYDIRIEAYQNGEGAKAIKNWKLVPVSKIMTRGSGKGAKPVKEDCPRFMVADVAEALGPEIWEMVENEIDELMDHYNDVIKKERVVSNIKKRFLRYRTDDTANTNTTRSTGMKRDLPVADEDEDNGNEEETGEAEEGTTKFRGLGGKFKR